MNPQPYYRRVSPAGTAGNVSGNALVDISPLGVYRSGLASTRPYGELARGGKMFTQFGLDALKENERAEYYDQLSRAKLAFLKSDFELKDSLIKNPDTSTWQTKREEALLSFKNSLEIKNKRAADDFELWLEGKNIEQEHYVEVQKLQRDADNFTNNFNASIKIRSAMASNTLDDQTYQKQVIETANEYGLQFDEQEGKFKPIENWDNEVLVGDAQTRMKLFQLWLMDTNSKRGSFLDKVKKEALDQLESNVLSAAANVRNEKDGRIDFTKANKLIEDSELPTENKIAAMNRLENLDSQERLNDERAWLNWKGEQDGALDKYLVDGNYNEGIEYLNKLDSGLKGEYATRQIEWKNTRKTMFENALKAKEQPLQTDWSVYAQIKSKISSYRNVENAREQILLDITKNSDKLKDAEIKGLINDLDKEVESDDAHWRRVAEQYGAQLLTKGVNPQNGLISGDADQVVAYGKFLLLLDKEIEDAQTVGKPLKGRDIYIKASELATSLLPETGIKLKGIGGGKVEPISSELGEKKTEQEPKTVRIQMPDGRIWNVPKDKVDAAMKRGGKKL